MTNVEKRIWLLNWLNDHKAFEVEDVTYQKFSHFFNLLSNLLSSFEDELKKEKLKNTQRNEN